MSPAGTVRKRVLVTRTAEQAGKLSEALRAAGFEPVEVPVLRIVPLESPADLALLDAALRGLTDYDWLILTSANTVRVLVHRAGVLGLSFAGNSIRVAAIGVATADAARQSGFAVALVPEKYVAEELVAALSAQITQTRILLVRAAIARDLIPAALRIAGASVDVVDAYKNEMPAAAPEQLRAALGVGIDAVAFTSSSSVTHLAEAAQRAGIAFPFGGVFAVSIGPITSQTLREAGWEPAAEARSSDIAGLVEAVVVVLSS